MIPDSIEIREATGADITTLVASIRSAFEEYRGLLDPPSGALTETAGNVARLLENETALVASAYGEAVGVVFYDLREDPVCLHRLAVLPDLRDRGIGARLVKTVEERVSAAGMGRIHLAVRISLVANHLFYMNLGYSIVDVRIYPECDFPTYYVMYKELTNPTPRDQRLIEVVAHDPVWARQYAVEAERLRTLFGPELIDIHHIGSTAIIGIHSKPIIDILPVVRDIRVLDILIPAMGELGYEAKGEYGIPGRRYFRRVVDNQHTHHIHAFEAGHPDIDRHVDFCAYLNVNPVDALRYSEIKQRMAIAYPHNIVAYNDGKGPFIREIEAKMRGRET